MIRRQRSVRCKIVLQFNSRSNKPRHSGFADRPITLQPPLRPHRPYTNFNLRDLLNAPKSDELIRDFAIIVSMRDAVLLRDQEITLSEQKVALSPVNRKNLAYTYILQ